MESICIACFEESKNLVGLDEKITKYENVIECYQRLTSIVIKSKENETKICKKCFGKLKRAFEFKEQCLLNYSKYMDKLVKEEESHTLDPLETIIVKEEPDPKPDPNNEIDIPLFSITEIKEEKFEPDTSVIVASKPKLKSTVPDIKKTKKPKSGKKKYVSKGTKSNKKSKEDQVFECRFCLRVCKGPKAKYNIRTHERRIHFPKESQNLRRKWICDLCGSVRQSRFELENHMRSLHLGIKNNHICDICGKGFFSRICLTSHRKAVHQMGDKKYQCAHCDRAYTLKQYLVAHLKYHFTQRNLQCNKCGQTFFTRFELTEHLRSHTNFYHFECKTCGKKFQRQTNYRIHVKNHVKKAAGIVFKCQICGVEVSRKDTLQNHQKIHQNIKDFPCMYCEKKFTLKGHLMRHVLAMHITSKYKCKLCGFEIQVKKFFQKNYIKHVKESHQDLTPKEFEIFELEIKKLKFHEICPDLPASLKGGRTACSYCEFCKIKFASAEQCQNHKQKVHGISRVL